MSPSSQVARHGNDAPVPIPHLPVRKILFASAHSIVDFSNGASVATLDVLQGLTAFGFDAQAFCTPKLDLPHEACFEQIIRDLREPYQVRASACGPHRAKVLYTRRRDVPITVVRLDSTRHVRQRPEEVHAVLEFFRVFLDVLQPDVMLTYGGDPVSVGMIDVARRRGIPVVFAIHNLNYQNAPPLDRVDYRIVASEFARRHYAETVGLECHVLPNPVDWERVRVGEPEEPLPEGNRLNPHPVCARSDTALSCGTPLGYSGGVVSETQGAPAATLGSVMEPRWGTGTSDRYAGGVAQQSPGSPLAHPGDTRTPCPVPTLKALHNGRHGAGQATRARRRFVTFVNPVPEKGVGPFVRIAQELGRRRPDVRFLVVESRGTRQTLSACGLGRDDPVNVQLMPNTTDPRKFYALTRVALLPSLCPENQPLVAVESMINGIPVIGSDRGGIPEVLGRSGFVLPLPERLTPASPVVPEAEEVEAWVETIVRLWDDRALYERQSRLAREEARRWHPDRLRPLYAAFFGNVRRRAGPALVRSLSPG